MKTSLELVHLGECFPVNNMFKTRKADENFSMENFQIFSKSHRRINFGKIPKKNNEKSNIAIYTVRSKMAASTQISKQFEEKGEGVTQFLWV